MTRYGRSFPAAPTFTKTVLPVVTTTFTGVGAPVEAPDTAAGTGTLPQRTGAGSPTEARDTSAGTGTFTAGGGGGGTITMTPRYTTPTRAVANGGAGGSGDFTSASFTTAAGTVLVAVVTIDNQDFLTGSDIPTPATTGLTWVKKGEILGSAGSNQFSANAIIYAADNGSAGSKTFAMSGTGTWDTGVNTLCLWIGEFSGAAATASQTKTAGTFFSSSGSQRDPATKSVTLPATAATSSWVIGGYAGDSGGLDVASAGSGWTEESTQGAGGGINALVSHVETRTGTASTAAVWTDLASADFVFDYVLIGWEVVAAGGASSVSGSGTPVEARDTAAGAGTFTPAAGSFTGSGTPTEHRDTAAGTGTFTAGGGGGTGVLGYSAIGALTDITSTNWDTEIYTLGQYTAVAGDTVTAVNVYQSSTTAGTTVVGIYTYSGGVPVTLVGTVDVTMTGSVGWKTAACSFALTAGTVYVIGLRYCGAPLVSGWSIAYDATGTVSIGSQCAAFPSTWSQSGTGTATISVYGDVTHSGAPTVTGSGAVTEARDTSAGVGSILGPNRTGSGAVTERRDTAFGVGSSGALRYPKSISGRHVLDQTGRVQLIRTFSSWAMASHLTNAEITTALEGVAANHFNGVSVWMGGTENNGGTGWTTYLNKAGQNFWSGTPWVTDTAGSGLGPAWASVDWLMTEAQRLGITVHFSFCHGNTGGAPFHDWATTSDANMYNVGYSLATRYAAYPNIVWHVMFDNNPTPSDLTGQKANKIFEGINAAEGATTRPVRWTEVNNGTSTNGQGWYDPTGASTNTRFSINCLYSYAEDMAEQVEVVWSEVSGPVGNCEPGYIGSGNYSGNERQQVRESNYAQFFEGGCLINYGDEAWWPFGAQPLLGGRTDWYNVPTDVPTIQASYCWDFIDTWLRDAAFAPTSGFVTTGEGSGDTRAAQGASATVAVAYFPDNRTVAVNTTILDGNGNVRLRWFDPVLNSYSTISASEAQQTGRSVTVPAAHADGTRDYVLVADLLELTLAIDNLTVATTLDNLDLTGSGFLTINDLTVTTTLDNVNLTGVGFLAIDNLTVASTLDVVPLTTTTPLTINDLTVATTMDSVALTVTYILAVDDLTVPTSMDSPSLTQAHLLTIDNVASATTLENVTLGIVGDLGINDLAVTTTLGNLDLIQTHSLVVDDLTVAVTVDSVTIIISGTSLEIDDTTSTTTLENVDLEQIHVLGINDMHVSVALSNVTLINLSDAPINTGPLTTYSGESGDLTTMRPQ